MSPRYATARTGKMPRIAILTVGKIKENYVQDGIDEYMKRMKNRRIVMIEVKDFGKEKEGEEISRKLGRLDGYLTVSLDEHGKELTSKEFSGFIDSNISRDICFIIGGPDGLAKSVLEKTDHKISLSRMTFNHEMARLFLIEQLYRAFSIIDGKEYHR